MTVFVKEPMSEELSAESFNNHPRVRLKIMQEFRLKLLHDFGSLPNVCAKFGKAGGPNVR